MQGLVITEHHYLWSAEELEALRREAGLGDGLVLMAAQEVETEIGHVLVFGAGHTVSAKTRLVDLRAAFPKAALVWAHPFRWEREPPEERLRHPLLDAVEIFNSNHTAKGNFLALTAWHRHKFVAVGGSDAHADGTVGMCPTQLDHPVTDVRGLAGEIRAGRCRPFFKEIPKSGSNLAVTEITIGTKGDDELRQRIVVKRYAEPRKWRQQACSLHTVAALHDRSFSGGIFRVPRIIEVNEQEHLVIEEGARGRTLFELLATVSPAVGQTYFDLAAGWLGRMHDLSLRVSTPEHALRREKRRVRSYRRAFVKSDSPYLPLAEAILERVESVQERVLTGPESALVQCHGDYHPKNIIIGQDRAQDIATLFVSVIDFAGTMLGAPALDVGYFLAQFRYQLREHPALLERLDRGAFLRGYREEAPTLAGQEGFDEQVTFYELRGNLSIAAFLVKVGMGESPEMAALMGRTEELEAALSQLAA
jgi:hypothetical protein